METEEVMEVVANENATKNETNVKHNHAYIVSICMLILVLICYFGTCAYISTCIERRTDAQNARFDKIESQIAELGKSRDTVKKETVTGRVALARTIDIDGVLEYSIFLDGGYGTPVSESVYNELKDKLGVLVTLSECYTRDGSDTRTYYDCEILSEE